MKQDSRFVTQAVSDCFRTPEKTPPVSLPCHQEETYFAIWLGHATVLVWFNGIWVITDPVLSNRIGLHLPFFTIGPKRYISPPVSFDKLPDIDLMLVSHAHMLTWTIWILTH